LGITVSRRIGKAVVRNRAKRLIREAFRRCPELWSSDVDLIVIVKRPLERMKTDDVMAEWRAGRSWITRSSIEARKDRTHRDSELANRG
jgi:ribonuclease P protein component